MSEKAKAHNRRKADRAKAIQIADENFHAAWASGDDYDIRRCLLVLETILSASSPGEVGE